MLQLQSFTRHSQSALHQQACRVGGGEVMDAPPLEEFEAAWEAAAAGSSSAAGPTSSLLWCLSKAIRDAARETLKKAEASSIQLDERHSRLLVKYHACNHDLQVWVGVLALLQNVGKTAP